MAKIFGILLIVLGVWLGIEIYTQGMDHAFGGVLAGFAQPIHSNGKTSYDQNPSGAPTGSPAAGAERGSLAQRVGTKVQADIDRGAERDDSDAEDNN